MTRVLDVAASLFGLIILSPLMVAISIWIAVSSPGPVLFRQTRIGYRGHAFQILKFRTMVHDAEKRGGNLTVGADPRITRPGRLLRRTKLDELPQLINVLKGDMSLVGPRPEVQEYVALYTPEQRKVLTVRPGITDPASIEFRNESELLVRYDDPDAYYRNEVMPRKIELNLEYVERKSLWTDLLVIAQTVLALLGRSREGPTRGDEHLPKLRGD